MDTKRCPTCETVKPLSDFSLHRGRSDGRQSVCKPCKRQRDKVSYRKNPHWYREKNRRILLRNSTYLADYLMGHPCVDCHEKDIVVLEFDHLGDKVEAVSVLAAQGAPLKKLAAEIEKCEVRCANCHKRKTSERGQHFRWMYVHSGIV